MLGSLCADETTQGPPFCPRQGDVAPVGQGRHRQLGEGGQRVLDGQRSAEPRARLDEEQEARIRHLGLGARVLFLREQSVAGGAQANLLAKIQDESDARKLALTGLADRGAADEHGNPLPTLREVFLFERRASPRGGDLGESPVVDQAVLRWRQVSPGEDTRQQLLPRISDEVQECLVGVGDPAVHVPEHDADDVGLDEAAEARLAVLERLHGSGSFSDVERDADAAVDLLVVIAERLHRESYARWFQADW